MTKMKFEAITANDLAEIQNLNPDGWATIVPHFEFYINSAFCYPLKTKINGKIVGVGAAIQLKQTGWLAHIIVDINHRSQGIGYQIVEVLLKQLKSMSVDTCSLIATELGHPTYLKAGFSVVAEYSFFERENRWIDLPPSNHVVPFKDSYRSMIFELDRKISGENRESLLAPHVDNSLIYVEQNRVLGYYMPDLGAGLIYADTDEAGLELMKVKYANIDQAGLPSANTVGIEFLKQHGFVKMQAVGQRMISGQAITWHPEKVFSRIGGNFG